jgi:hypothetical protein
MSKRLSVVVAALIMSGCARAGSTVTSSAMSSASTASQMLESVRHNELTATERAAGWRLLFDGRTLSGWHGLGFKQTPPGLWTVEDGAIMHAAKGKGPVQPDGQPLQGFDLVSDSSYQDYELAWEWKISEGGNSGLKYNVSEELSVTFAPPHAAKGWEYQMIDDDKNEDNKLTTHRSGALYDMLPPNEKKHVNPAGQWNRSMIVFRGTHGEHWLNGEKVVEYDLGSPQFDSAFAKSKYHSYPPWFPVRRKAQIVLQDHDDVVWFRDIKIHVLQ